MRAALDVPAVTEPREELAQRVDQLWRLEFDTPLPWVSGTRALAASVSFYASSHPRYWSLWNASVETPWADLGDVTSRGGVIVCETTDEACQRLAESWSADRRSLKVAKSTRSHQFAMREYVVYWVPPLSSDGLH